MAEPAVSDGAVEKGVGMAQPQRCIAMLDSGLGGLTVARELLPKLADSGWAGKVVYLGDSARLPYGSRSHAMVRSCALECARYLRGHGPAGLLVACNTISAVALDALKNELGVPVVGVVDAGARAAAEALEACRGPQSAVGVLATRGTVASSAYPAAIARRSPEVAVFQQEASLLVPLVEAGWLGHEVTRQVVDHYLLTLRASAAIDVLLLGCTHYPLIRELIEARARCVLGSATKVVDGSRQAADQLLSALGGLSKLQPVEAQPRRVRLELFLTDYPPHLDDLVAGFLDPIQRYVEPRLARIAL